MSLHEQARKLVEQAETAIQAGNPQYAIELLRQAILYHPSYADSYILLGIALAQTKMPVDAENAFRKAVQLAPHSLKARYNQAVHQYAQGQLQAALDTAREATQIDPRHAGSADLAARIEKELGIEPGERPKRTIAGNPAPEYRPGYEEQPVSTMPFIERLGPLWIAIGWGLAGMSAMGAVIMLLTVFRSGAGAANADQIVASIDSTPLGGLVRVLYFVSNIGGLAYIALDAINRRGNLLWLLPQAICGCTGFTFVVMPLYMAMGRKE